MEIDLEQISFAEWLIALNACAASSGYRGIPFVQITGQLCWYGDYMEGLSPRAALELTAQDGLMFGGDYVHI